MTLEHSEKGGVLVSDFDGTMTRHDFYRLAIEKLLPPDTPNYWGDYRSGTITHFEALRRYYSAIRASEKEVLAVVDGMELDPDLPRAINSLHHAGWEVVVASAGCAWYIHRLLDAAGVKIVVHSNPGRFEPGKGILMEMPRGSAFISPTHGIDKAGVVRHFLAAGRTVAFAGDGYPDAESARLVLGELRFARGDLANVLQKEQVPFHPFARWSDVASILLKPSA